MKVATHFATPLIEFRMENPDAICDRLLDTFLECESQPDKYRNETKRSTQHGLFESRFDLFEWQQPAVQEVARFCHTGVYNVVANLTSQPEEDLARLRFDYHSWFHVTRHGGFQGMHNHQNASWSGIFCIDPGDQPEDHPESGIVRFHDPRSCAFMYMDHGNRLIKAPFNHGATQVRHERGKLVVFPSHIMHEIFPYFGERPRVIIAFNCWVGLASKKP